MRHYAKSHGSTHISSSVQEISRASSHWSSSEGLNTETLRRRKSDSGCCLPATVTYREDFCVPERKQQAVLWQRELHITHTHTHIPSRSNCGIVARDVILSLILLVWSKRKGFTFLLFFLPFTKSCPEETHVNGQTDRQAGRQTDRYLGDWRTSGRPRQPDPHRPDGWRRRWRPRGSHVSPSGSLTNSLQGEWSGQRQRGQQQHRHPDLIHHFLQMVTSLTSNEAKGVEISITIET